jgi:hypothetical protein
MFCNYSGAKGKNNDNIPPNQFKGVGTGPQAVGGLSSFKESAIR